MLVNAINGSEVDCILSALSVPLQEDFIAKTGISWMQEYGSASGIECSRITGRDLVMGSWQNFCESYI